MKHLFLSFFLFAISLAPTTKAQSVDSLNQLKDHGFAVYYSSGHQPRANATALQIEKALSYMQDLLGSRPTITLIVLSAKDWDTYTADPVVYGMPHYNEKDKRLIVAAEDNAFWKSFLPPPDQLPENLRKPVQTTYGSGDGHLTMQAFFDLLAVHELGHAFHMQGGLTIQRTWMGELFCNILLHTYIAEKEPALLPALTLFPQMVVAGGSKEFEYTTLQDIQRLYNEIAQKHPKNYGWYQCRWHASAAGIYDAGGKQVLQKLWNALKIKKEKLTDEQLISLLRTKVDKSVGDMMEYWDRDTVK